MKKIILCGGQGVRIPRSQKYLGEDHLMITCGDALPGLDYEASIAFHCIHRKFMTVTGVRPRGLFGEIEIDGDRVVPEFNENPQAIGGRISSGFMCVSS
tara:strand:- start:10 stop:306 length:297 start_codon:yes stop_codon:yes gene_type:complete